MQPTIMPSNREFYNPRYDVETWTGETQVSVFDETGRKLFYLRSLPYIALTAK